MRFCGCWGFGGSSEAVGGVESWEAKVYSCSCSVFTVSYFKKLSGHTLLRYSGTRLSINGSTSSLQLRMTLDILMDPLPFAMCSQ